MTDEPDETEENVAERYLPPRSSVPLSVQQKLDVFHAFIEWAREERSGGRFDDDHPVVKMLPVLQECIGLFKTREG